MAKLNQVKVYVSVGLVIILFGSETFNTEILPPIFPLYAEARGISITAIGITLGLNYISALICAFFLPSLLRPSNLKTFYIFGLYLGSIMLLSFGLLDLVENKYILITFGYFNRGLNGLSMAIVYACGVPVVINLYSKRSGMLVSLLQSFSGAAAILAPAVACILYRLSGYMCPFLSLGTIQFVLTTILVLIIPKTTETEQAEKENKSSWKEDLRKFVGLRFFCYIFPYYLCVVTTAFRITALAIFLKERFDINESNNFYVFFALSIPYTISAPIFGYLLDRGFLTTLFLSSIVAHPLILLCYILMDFLPQCNNLTYLIVILVISGTHCSSTALSSLFQLRNYAEKCDFNNKLNELPVANQCFSIVRLLGKLSGSIIFGGLCMDYFGFIPSLYILFFLTLLTVPPILYLTIYDQ